MTTNHFLQILRENPGKELVFEYRPDFFVPKAYHITEVKNVHIQAVDCGGRPSEDFQTIVQLWVSGEEVAARNMNTEKALKIFEIVDRTKPMRGNADLLLEWGDAYLPTSNYHITDMVIAENQVIVKMFVQPTACKPKLELELAGASTLSCCA